MTDFALAIKNAVSHASIQSAGGQPHVTVDTADVHETRQLPPDHPDAAALLERMAGRFPHWHSGWAVPPATDTFLVLYTDGRPTAGAALAARADGLADVSRLSAVGPDEEADGRALLAAVEQAARERGCERLRLDATAFLLFRDLPGEYRTGPPYDGDEDVPVWVERQLG